MRFSTILALATLLLLCHSCHRELPPQSVAGYIVSVSGEQEIVVEVTDSATIKLAAPRTMSFAIDDNTTYESNGIVEGNIVEVIYQPADDEPTPTAIEIATDDTYPRALGRWANNEHSKLRIDIELLPNGHIRQRLPAQTMQFKSWQLTKDENIITIAGEVSLPPIVAPKPKTKESKDKSEQAEASPARRTMAFTTTATIGIDGDRRTLTMRNNKKEQAVLYRAE